MKGNSGARTIRSRPTSPKETASKATAFHSYEVSHRGTTPAPLLFEATTPNLPILLLVYFLDGHADTRNAADYIASAYAPTLASLGQHRFLYTEKHPTFR